MLPERYVHFLYQVPKLPLKIADYYNCYLDSILNDKPSRRRIAGFLTNARAMAIRCFYKLRISIKAVSHAKSLLISLLTFKKQYQHFNET